MRFLYIYLVVILLLFSLVPFMIFFSVISWVKYIVNITNKPTSTISALGYKLGA